MRYNPKFTTDFVIQCHYGQGWEDDTTEANLRDAKAQLKCYRENSPYPCRIVRRKVANLDYIQDAMTKSEAEKWFKMDFYPSLDKTDRPLIRFEWNCFVDMLQKDRKISAEQAANWCHPKFVA